ncbi:hypothetical protein MSHRCOH1_05830 [Candidatus Ornithobacterium hominis]|uniref:hypothetical protein n=1 Tax=Candidatus Ornithobacterium hominis TaxID=2497989 RepID=UPI0024BCFC6E|nr:hypothetical protein [Candidatus Ornithobacterium hominis]CAI9429713.1 hypothetical protein MSHRCOH1_05830 [Candidatus Ornithobacterium hominis]
MKPQDKINTTQQENLINLINGYSKAYFAKKIRKFMQIALYNYLLSDDRNVDAEDMYESWYLLSELLEVIEEG